MVITRKNKKRHSPKIELNKSSNVYLMKVLNNYSHLINNNIDNDDFFELIFETLKKASNQQSKMLYEESVSAYNELNPLNLKSSYFLDESILSDIRKHVTHKYSTTFIIHERFKFQVNIHFDKQDKTNISSMIKHIQLLLCFCLNYYNNEKVIRKFNIDVYLCKTKKGLQKGFTNVIEPKHINSGYYMYNDELEESNIVVYRKEEWFKTLIHEVCHNFNLDFQTSKISFRTFFKDCFHINSSFLLNESFTEFWARTINSAFFTYLSLENKTLSKFKKAYNLNLNLERVFSMYQAYKLLKIFGVNYKSIVDPNMRKLNEKLYRETTNAFCYYVITSILMYDYNKTLNWFTNGEYQSLNFNKSEREIMIFCYYIKICASSEGLLSIFEEIEKNDVRLGSMRMSVFEYC